MSPKLIGFCIALFLVTIAMPVRSFSYEEEVAFELIKDYVVNSPCDGGSVTAPGGLVIDCPSSGGPRCSTKEICTCAAILNASGGYDSENICKKKP